MLKTMRTEFRTRTAISRNPENEEFYSGSERPSFLKSNREIRLHVGEYAASRDPVVIYTLLGSCVSVCLHDAENRVGGMNHILMPGRADMRNYDMRARYAVNALELLINEIMKTGGRRARLTAKIFGGAHVLSTIDPENGVGRRNAEFAFDFLKTEGIPIVSYEVGGTRGRKIFFQADSGMVYRRYLRAADNRTIAAREKESMPEILERINRPGEVTLF